MKESPGLDDGTGTAVVAAHLPTATMRNRKVYTPSPSGKRRAATRVHVSREDFKTARRGLEETFTISMRARVLALWSFLTGNMLNTGDSPIADVKAQTIATSTNIALVSALILTVIVPIVLDAAPGTQTNSYMVTNPAWIGTSYFVSSIMAAWSFMISTMFAVLTILILNELHTKAECQYLVIVAQGQFIRPIQYFMLGLGFLIAALILWLTIVCFSLEDEEGRTRTCDDVATTNSSGAGDPSCEWYTMTFVSALVIVNTLNLHVWHNLIMVCACGHTLLIFACAS